MNPFQPDQSPPASAQAQAPVTLAQLSQIAGRRTDASATPSLPDKLPSRTARGPRDVGIEFCIRLSTGDEILLQTANTMTLPELLAPEMLPEAFDNFEQVVMTALFRPLFVSVKRRLEEAAKTTEGDGMPKLP